MNTVGPRGALVWGVAVTGWLTGCAQIVGIGDTAVSLDAASDAPEDRTALEGGADSNAAESSSPTGDASGAAATDATVDAAGDGASPNDSGVQADGTSPAQDGGVDGGACSPNSTRCNGNVLGTCTAQHAWSNTTCPTDHPTCAAGDAGAQCVVRGPTMVAVSTTPAYYVDGTEVTVGQYRAFLAAKGTDTSGQPAVCSWNTAFTTGAAMGPDNYPITNVDWCDALAFCTWAGKHLCGKIGGGPVPSASALDPTKSQWFLACGGPSGNSHPNGSSVCNSSGGIDGLAAVATFPMCQGYYQGLFDLEGNAAEWIDSCDPGDGGAKSDPCYLAGGNYIDNQSYCDEDYAYPRSETSPAFGFRCCGG